MTSGCWMSACNLLAELGAGMDERVTMHQALLELSVHLGRWGPAVWLESCAEFGQGLGINRVSLGAFEQRFGEIVGLGRIDHRHGEAGGVQAARQAHPIGASRFHD